MDRGKGRPASKTPTKTARTTIRMYPREQEQLRRESARHGMNQTDYLMLLLACRPHFESLKGKGEAYIDLLRRYGLENDHAVMVGEDAAVELSSQASKLLDELQVLIELIEHLTQEVDLLQKSTYVDATLWISKIDAQMKSVSNAVRAFTECSEAMTAVAIGRKAKTWKARVHVTDKAPALFPRREDASTLGGE